MLSGGVDSSLVSLFAARGVDELLTFNVKMPDPKYDETWAADEASRTIGSHHRTLALEAERGTWDTVTEVLRQVGQPFADTSVFAVDAVSRAMREHVTVALSGDGGDEGFGGYDAYWQLGTIERFRRLPVGARRGLARVLSPFAAVRPLSQLSRRVAYVAEADDVGTVQALFSWIRPAEHARLVRDLDHVEPVRRLFEPHWDHSPLNGASRLERLSALAVEANIRLVLPNDFLVKVDTASMRHSLEVRVPLLDEDVIALGLSLPHALRVDGRAGKRVLREVARRHLPASVVDRPKQGFSVPGDRWAGPAFRDNLRETLLGADNTLSDYLNRVVYEPWVRAFCNGETPARISRGGLLQRVTMALALDLSLRGLAVPQGGDA
jgi:asparagine synthase (glutamine-hydrolysing)